MQFHFAGCVLDTDSPRLTRAGQNVPVEPQVFDLLALLAGNAGRIVSKDEIVDAVWQGRAISDAAISARISSARAAVGDDGQKQQIIRTVPRRGLEFRAAVNAIDAPRPTPDHEAPKPDAMPRIRYAKSRDGTRIAWMSSGEGPPVLRTSHHLSHLERDWLSPFWQPLFARLGAQHSLLRYDVRGTGMSDTNLDGAGIEDYVQDMAAVADAAELDQFALVSHLQSAPVAIRYIAENPGRVIRFVVHEGYARGRAMRANSPASPDSDPVIALMKNGWGDPQNGFMRAWVSMIIPNGSYQEVTDTITLISGATPPELVVPSRQIIDRFDVSDILDQVHVPTLIIHSRGDTIHPLDEARILARGIEGAELMILESAHTLVYPSDPEWENMMSATLEFLGRG